MKIKCIAQRLDSNSSSDVESESQDRTKKILFHPAVSRSSKSNLPPYVTLIKCHLLVSQEISQYQRSLGGDKMFYVASLQRR